MIEIATKHPMLSKLELLTLQKLILFDLEELHHQVVRDLHLSMLKAIAKLGTQN